MASSSTIMESLFQRSLDDLIRSLRSPTPAAPLPSLIAAAAADIRRELKSPDPSTKSVALHKLTYLHSLHALDMSFAAFLAVQLLPSPTFSHKKLAYLAASLSFHPATDVLLLLPNQLRKDLTSSSPYDACLALELLAVAATPDLARELTPDVFNLLSSAKLPLRKRAVALLVRLYELYPDSVRVTFKRLVENLAGDSGVVSAVVGVFCELSAKDPGSYLPLAPEFYRILTESRNNWVLIKVVKIFARLAPLEPRLAKRVVEPICEAMGKTSAKSLMFECVRAVVTGFTGFESAVRLAAEKIRELLVDEDPNLKYLGLHALSLLMGKELLWAVVDNKDVIVRSLNDGDVNIKLEALRLLMGMVSEANVEEISKVLISYAMKSDPDFCNEILGSLLGVCGRNLYEIINDFDWYVCLLGDMARVPNCAKGDEIECQMIDIGLRVKDARLELVQVARGLLIDPALLGSPNLYRVLAAASWVSGEYVEFSRSTRELMEALLQPRTCLLPPLVRAVYIQSVFKVLVYSVHCCMEDIELRKSKLVVDDESSELTPTYPVGGGGVEDPSQDSFSFDSVNYLLSLTKEALEPLLQSDEVEVHDRACNALGLIYALEEAGFETQDPRAADVVRFVRDALDEKLGPVGMNAQARVPVPDGLVLKEDLSDLDSLLEGIAPSPNTVDFVGKLVKISDESPSMDPSAGSSSRVSEHRKRHSLYYLSADKDDSSADNYPLASNDSVCETTNELVKLTDQSMVTKKIARVKPRPVVVKLEEGDEGPSTQQKPTKVIKESSIAGAVQDVLGGEKMNYPDRASEGRKGLNSSSKDPGLAENQGIIDKSKTGSSSIRKSKHRSGSKERNKSPRKGEDKDTKKSGHKKGKQKSRHKTDGQANVVPQSPVIQDFLL